jgi:hypothetical protein
MQEEINRVAADLNVWRNREERFEKLFPGTLRNNRPFLIEKLDYLDNIQAKYGRSANEEERLKLRILKQERNNLAKAIYPGVLSLLFRYILLPFKQMQAEQTTIQNKTENIQALNEKVLRTGFGAIDNQLRHHIEQGQNSFSIPVSYYVNEKEHMNFQLSFVKDGIGQYQLDGYTAAFNNEQKITENRQQNFSVEHGYLPTAEQAYNLLAGRAIQQESISQDGYQRSRWKQLDLNDKDNTGNYRIKEFTSAYGYDIKKVIAQLPLKELSSVESTEKLVNSLTAGNRQEVTIQNNGIEQKLLIDANPQFKTLNIYDNGKKVSLASVLADKTKNVKQQPKNVIPLKPAFKKKNGLSAK